MVLWRGVLDLSRDLPNSDVDLLASRNRVLVRKDLHPALQYLLLEAMREVHWPAGPFNRASRCVKLGGGLVLLLDSPVPRPSLRDTALKN